ncbi:hypothetical protein GCM10023185_04320 [Hymenobacter saemangeumensis]|uniref:Immunity protein 51 of polymorphic toxin system n=1 Tax=Hymenobacter saemangeumensis TaxID=1084522 RepID=A0ABP8I058_9BACT
MPIVFPFQIDPINPVHPAMPERRFCIQSPVGELEEYRNLFEDFGYSGNGPSWVEHISTMLEEADPDILEHLEFDEEGDTFVVYADSEAVVRRFLLLVQPVFGSTQLLKKYLSQTDPSDFFE